MSKVVQSAFVLFIATMASKVVGFLRDVCIAYVYGAGVVSDSYLMALNIMTVAFMSLLCVAIQSTYMPIFTSIEAESGKGKALKFTSNVINIIIIISLGISIFGWFFTKPIVKIFAMGFEGERLALTIQLTRIILFSVGLICVTYVLKAYLEIHSYFFITGIMPLPYNIAIISSVLLSKVFGVGMLAYGTVLAFLLQMLFLVPYCMKKGFKYKFIVNFKDKNVRKMALAIMPILVGASAYQINSLVDKNLASTLVTGSMSALNYAYKLNIFVIGLFVASITSVIYPVFSKLGSNKEIKQLKKTYCQSINAVILITMPIAVGAFILAEPIIRILFERGAFDATATAMTAQVLMCYCVGMTACGMRDITVRVFYSLQDTKVPMRNSIFCVVFNIIFNLLLIRFLKVSGLALASSLSAILAVLFLMFNLRKKIGRFNIQSIIRTIFKTGASALAMAIVVRIVFGFVSPFNEFIGLFVSIGSGAIVYAIMVLVLKVESTKYVIEKVNGKLNRKVSRKMSS